MADILSELKVVRESCGSHIPDSITTALIRAEREITNLRSDMSMISDDLSSYLKDAQDDRSDSTIEWCVKRATNILPASQKKPAA